MNRTSQAPKLVSRTLLLLGASGLVLAGVALMVEACDEEQAQCEYYYSDSDPNGDGSYSTGSYHWGPCPSDGAPGECPGAYDCGCPDNPEGCDGEACDGGCYENVQTGTGEVTTLVAGVENALAASAFATPSVPSLSSLPDAPGTVSTG